jgi:hypothetical protein
MQRPLFQVVLSDGQQWSVEAEWCLNRTADARRAHWGNSHQIARPWHLDELRQGQTSFEGAISLLS